MSVLRLKSKRKLPSNIGVARLRPTWEVAGFFPFQGEWTEDDFFELDSHLEAAPRVELVNGRLEVLPMPTEIHQSMMVLLVEWLTQFARKYMPGKVLCSGMKIRVKNGAKPKFRDPDIVYMKAEHRQRRHQKYWEGADLVMEIVSGSKKDRRRDWEIKPKEYAAAGIPEYWIIDPQKKVICVMTLAGTSYAVHGNFKPGSTATSALLPGFKVSVDDLLAADED
jgi:Uma2 family endonuclease